MSAARSFLQKDFEEASMLQDRLLQMSLDEIRAYFRENLARRGTNVQRNDQDPYGDGDQSPVSASNAQFYRDMFACGGDLVQQQPHLSQFANQCLMGSVDAVRRLLQYSSNITEDDEPLGSPPLALTQLLETRETSLRLSPLLMIVSLGKNVSIPGIPDSKIAERQIQVAKLLLQYGARPDARDVSGKTVFHYGMGVMATDMTVQVVRMCSQAYDASSYLYGKKVELFGLEKAPELNGVQAWCQGYVVDKGRRSVYLMDTQNTVAIKPENLKAVVDEDAPTTKLCDIPDRLGTVCLHEVIQSDRVDIGKLLLKDYQANLDVADCDGISPRNMGVRTAMGSRVAAMVNKAAGARGKQEQARKDRTCSNRHCGVVESSSDSKLLECAICHSVQYCSKDCQRQHWKEEHKQVCKDMAAKKSVAIVLDPPVNSGLYVSRVSLSSSRSIRGSATEPQRDTVGYRKPSHVAVGETFDLKVQGINATTALMVYDKSRECDFSVSPGTRGFDELWRAVQAEPAWQGRKTFVAASFDAQGNCTVYPGLTSVQKW